MNNIPISNKIPELDLAIKAAQEAGNIILKIYEKGFKTFTKTDNSPVTDADLQSNKIINRNSLKSQNIQFFLKRMLMIKIDYQMIWFGSLIRIGWNF